MKLVKTKISNPLELADIKQHLNIDDDYNNDDQYLNVLADVVIEYIEGEINVDALKTSNILTLDNRELIGYKKSIRINEGNFNTLSATTINNIDVTTGCTVYDEFNHFVVEFPDYVTTDDIVIINFTTGFDELPKSIQQAALIKIADLYDVERTSQVANISVTKLNVIEALLKSYKRIYY